MDSVVYRGIEITLARTNGAHYQAWVQGQAPQSRSEWFTYKREEAIRQGQRMVDHMLDGAGKRPSCPWPWNRRA